MIHDEAHQGRHSPDRDLQVRLSERASRPSLTPREVQVTELIAQGMRNTEIAGALGISEETGQVHGRTCSPSSA